MIILSPKRSLIFFAYVNPYGMLPDSPRCLHVVYQVIFCGLFLNFFCCKSTITCRNASSWNGSFNLHTWLFSASNINTTDESYCCISGDTLHLQLVDQTLLILAIFFFWTMICYLHCYTAAQNAVIS